MTADFGNFVAKTDKNKIWNETNISYVIPNKTQKNWGQDHSQMLLRRLTLKKTLLAFNAINAPKTFKIL